MQGPGPMCYIWVDWLQCTALQALGYSDGLPVQSIAAALQIASISPAKTAADPAQQEADADAVCIAADPGVSSWEKLLVQLLQADASRDFQLFQEVRAHAAAVGML